MLYPQKNLMPILDKTNYNYGQTGYENIIVGNKLAVTSYSSSHFGYGAWVDVEINKTYTFSALVEQNLQSVKGLLRIGYSFTTTELAASEELNGKYSVTFTPTRSKIFVRFSTSSKQALLSPVYFSELQLEEGTTATKYEPYKLGMKKAVLDMDIVAPDMSGSTHKPTNGNVFSILKDVRVNTSKINVMETGVFSVGIYEWKDGSGIVGAPLYKQDTTYNTTGIYTYDFGGVLLTAGKKYWIGRCNNVGQAGLMRTLGASIGNPKHVSWQGGADYTGTTVVYPTTYYYFYNLEFNTGKNKPATLQPKKNHIPPLSDSRWYLKSGQVKGEIVNDYEYKMTLDRVGVVGYDIPITLKPNTTYTLGATVVGSGARMRLLRNDNEGFVVSLNPADNVQRYTTSSFTDFRIRIENNGQAGTFTTKDFYIYEGDHGDDPPFEPYKAINKPASLIYDANAITSIPLTLLSLAGNVSPTTVDDKMIYNGKAMYKVEVVDGSVNNAKYGGHRFAVTAGKTYLSQAVVFDPSNVYRYTSVYNTGSAPFINDLDNGQYATVIDLGKGFKLIRHRFKATESVLLSHGFIHYIISANGNKMWFGEVTVQEDIQKSYLLANKPAILYPQKNLIPPFTNKAWALVWNYEIVNDNKVILHGQGNWDVSKVVVPVEVGQKYTLSSKITGEASIEVWEDGVINMGSFSKDVNIAGGFAARTYTPTRRSAEIRIVNSTKNTKDSIIENLQFEKADSKTDFEPYKLGNKPL